MDQGGKRSVGKREAAIVNPWIIPVRAVGIGLLSTVLLLGLCAALITMAVIPERYMDGCVLFSCVVGTLIGGWIATHSEKGKAMLWGLGIGLTMAALMGAAGMLLYHELSVGWCAAVSCACACGGGVAGVIGGRCRKKRRVR